ncbi:MLO-like protein 11 isoform X2 [Telopea speciosissima]|uniref:MLO-like protein 11 isoform X2 n=1 Tax=Telopea speciosissima TaxID=54955 RepID=UPI001CC3CC77|nr:MLO-like protein 11 isoform X2 [Telopea speciosissima]
MDVKEARSLALTPTWSVATVLSVFVAVSLIVERSIHRLSHWLQKTNRKPLYEAVEKMKEELMLLGLISLLLTATSRTISNICIETKFFASRFDPCSASEVEASEADNSTHDRKLSMGSILHHSFRSMLSSLNQNTCKKGHEPFVSYEGLEQLHRFIFVMAITHVSYSCLTMLLAIVKTCFFRQFGHSVIRADYLTLRMGFITNHNLTAKFDFHSYMVRSMEEEFQRIVGVSAPLWGFVVAFMLFNVKGSNLYFWIAIIPIILVLMVGTKLQHIVATLTLENAGINGFFGGTKLKPRDELFWFKKPKLLLSLIHFVLFQNAFELASFFWFWWQFGYDSCYIRSHFLVYTRLILGFAGQFLCSYSTLPLYALVTQMGTHYKAALIPQRIRDTIHGWGKATRRRRRHGHVTDDSTIHTEASTRFSCLSIEEDDQLLVKSPAAGEYTDIELQPIATTTASPSPVANETSSLAGMPLLKVSTSLSSSTSVTLHQGRTPRSNSMPSRRG